MDLGIEANTRHTQTHADGNENYGSYKVWVVEPAGGGRPMALGEGKQQNPGARKQEQGECRLLGRWGSCDSLTWESSRLGQSWL